MVRTSGAVFAGKRPEIEQIVIAGINSMRVGFVVDHVIGQHQTVLKSLGRILPGEPSELSITSGSSGAAASI